MKKKHLLLVLKILAIVMWIFVLFLPEMCAGIQDVKHLSIEMASIQQSEPEYKEFNVEFSEKVVEGSMIVQFFDDNDSLIIEQVIEIRDNDSNIVKFKMPNNNFHIITNYKVKSSHVKTPLVKNMKIVCSISSVLLLVLVILVIRIDYEEYKIESKKVKIYSGIIRHYVKIDENIWKKNCLILTKQRSQEFEMGNKKLNVVFAKTNQIEIELLDAKNDIAEWN